MRNALYILISLCFCMTQAQAQRLTKSYTETSLSDVLIDLNKSQHDKRISFIYNELEDFTVTTGFRNSTVDNAVREVVGFYPMKITMNDSLITVECIQKEAQKVIGHVIDEHGQPVEFANVALLSSPDSAFINGGVTNQNGDFVIPCRPGRMLIRVTFVGYKTHYQSCTVGEVGNIRLKKDAIVLQNVVVKGEIPQYKMVQGGMSVDVQHSILHDVGSAEDLLSMLPMVQGRDGKFEVLAKGEPEIYINNKKVRDGIELKQLKSMDVKNVEIITAPGAKYNAEVNAVIRIKTLKPQGDGFSLMATSQTWKNNKWNNYDDLTLKYRTGGLEAFATVALDNSHYSAEQDLEQELHIKKDKFDAQVELPIRSSWTQFQYKAGVSYDFNTDHSLGLSFSSQKLFYNKFKTDMEQTYRKNGAFYGDVLLKTDIDELDKGTELILCGKGRKIRHRPECHDIAENNGKPS